MLELFRQLKKREWEMMGVSVIFILVQVWLDLKMPEYMSNITRLVETPGSQMRDILYQGAFMLLCAIGSLTAAAITGFFAARIAAGFAKTLREKVFKKVMTFNQEEIGSFSTASLITRTTNDITQVQMIFGMGFQAIVKAPILLVWAIIKISSKQWQWTAATAGAVVVILGVLLIVIRLVLPKFQIIQKLTDNLNRVTKENLKGIRVVRAYNAEKYQTHKFEQANTDLTDTNLYANRVLALIWPTMTLVTSGISLVIYWIGAYLIYTADLVDRLTIFSDMVVFSSYAMQILMAFMTLTMMFIMLPRVMVSVRRIEEVLHTEVHMEDGTVDKGEGQEKGTVEFREVSFRYPEAGDDVLHQISFTAHQGETVAIIGATASGKSSLVQLIPRLYDVTDGQILVDGIDVRDYQEKTLRDKIGYIAQQAVLFSGTVASNVAYSGELGKEKEEEEDIWRSVDLAMASDFVSEMPDGVYSSISQGGTNISGGQKQRLSIARAIFKKPEILIFDDSFSALDYQTDQRLRKALNERTKETTKIIVAQRIGTIRDADQILVLEDGRIVGKGRHEELMKTCEVYQEIAYSQLSREEVDTYA